VNENIKSGDYIAKRMLVLSAPRATIALGGIFSAFSTVLPVALLNVGMNPVLVEKAFIIAYIVALPILVSAIYRIYRLASVVAELCKLPRPDATSFIIGVFPLGYVVPLYYVLQMFFRCEKMRGKINVTPMDIVLNMITFGLHSAMYAMMFNKICDTVLENLGEPY